MERQLVWVAERWRFRVERTVDGAFVHQIGTHPAGEAEWALHRVLSGLSQARRQKGDQRDSDLDRHRALASAEKAPDPEGLLIAEIEEVIGALGCKRCGIECWRSTPRDRQAGKRQRSAAHAVHRQALLEIVESGPTPAVHGVVRWRWLIPE